MKKNLLKRIGAVALSVAVSLTMGTAAFAAELGDNGTVTANDNSVTLKKAIEVTNYSGYAYEPTITYTYTLSNGTAGGTVTDDSNPAITAHYKEGKTTYLTSDAVQTAVFSSANAVTGSTASKDLKWTFDPSAFPAAGVYRYVVAETATSVTPASIGVVRPDTYDTSKFLDVYVKNGDNGLEIYGYALVDKDTTGVTSASKKSQGWNATTEGQDDLDKYKTYNITITKNITGAGADMTAEFPFTVALTGNMSAANIAVDGTGSDIGIASGSVTGKLGNGETLIIKGLPKTVTFDVSEDNPTPDTYKATATVSGVTVDSKAEGADLANEPIAVVTGGHVSTATTSPITIDVENNLGTISPTNVVMRFAPFLFIFGAAILLLVVMRRRRTQDAE